MIRRNADAQARLVDDLLDVSRITSGKLRLDVQPVPLGPVIAAVLDSVRPALDAKKIRVTTSIDSENIAAFGDESRIQQVIWNLLSNAAKFTPANGGIGIRLRRVASDVEIVVDDSGEGIEAEFLPYVSDRFRQADGGISPWSSVPPGAPLEPCVGSRRRARVAKRPALPSFTKTASARAGHCAV